MKTENRKIWWNDANKPESMAAQLKPKYNRNGSLILCAQPYIFKESSSYILDANFNSGQRRQYDRLSTNVLDGPR